MFFGRWSAPRATLILVVGGYIAILLLMGVGLLNFPKRIPEVSPALFTTFALIVVTFLSIAYVYLSEFNFGHPDGLLTFSYWGMLLHALTLGLSLIIDRQSITRLFLAFALPAGLSLALLFATSEVALRVIGYGQEHFVTDYELKIKRPTVDFRGYEYNYWVYHKGSPLKRWAVITNHLGWREHGTNRTSTSEPEIMFLGDSLTYGWGVDEEDTLSRVFFDEVSVEDPNASWNILNRSTPGWSTYDQLRYWNSLSPEEIPEVTVINVVMNDFKPESDSELDEQRAQLSIETRFLSSTRLFRLTKDWLGYLIRPEALKISHETMTKPTEAFRGKYPEDKLWYIRGTFGSSQKEDVYKKASSFTYHRLQRLADLIKISGSKPIFVIFPASAQVSTDYWTRAHYRPEILDGRPIAELEAWLHQNHHKFLNLLPVFRASEIFPLYIDSFHLSPEGNRLAATAIHEYLKRTGFLVNR